MFRKFRVATSCQNDLHLELLKSNKQNFRAGRRSRRPFCTGGGGAGGSRRDSGSSRSSCSASLAAAHRGLLSIGTESAGCHRRRGPPPPDLSSRAAGQALRSSGWRSSARATCIRRLGGELLRADVLHAAALRGPCSAAAGARGRTSTAARRSLSRRRPPATAQPSQSLAAVEISPPGGGASDAVAAARLRPAGEEPACARCVLDSLTFS